MYRLGFRTACFFFFTLSLTLVQIRSQRQTRATVYSPSSISYLPWCVSSLALIVCFLSPSLLWQRGDRGERAWGGCLHRTEWLWRDQWQFDGAADHDKRLQDCLCLQGHCCHPLLSVRPAGQEGQGGGEGYLSTYFCHAICHPAPWQEACSHAHQPTGHICFSVFFVFVPSSVLFAKLIWIALPYLPMQLFGFLFIPFLAF